MHIAICKFHARSDLIDADSIYIGISGSLAGLPTAYHEFNRLDLCPTFHGSCYLHVKTAKNAQRILSKPLVPE